jgi:protein-tyrosine phosphatase
MDGRASIELPAGRPLRVVIVCLGNICRSPMAAAVFRARLDEADLADVVEIDSAGTGSWHVGQGADTRAGATLRRHGYDDTHTARQLARHDLADFDLVLVADHANRSDVIDLARTPDEAAKVAMLRSFDRAAPADAEVPDPYYGDGDGFEVVIGMIEAAADGFVAAIDAAASTRR